MPLTEAEINAIKEEEEKEYPDIDWEWVNRLLEMKREVYIAAITKERERVKPLLEGLNKIKNQPFTVSYGTALQNVKSIAQTTIENYNKSLKQIP